MIEAFLLVAVLVAAGYGRAAWIYRRGAIQLRAQMAAHSRALGLLARDLAGSGLSLAGHAAGLPPPRDAAIGFEARQLSALADGIAEHLSATAGPRRLSPEIVPLRALLEESVATTATLLGPSARQWRVAPEFDDLTLTADRRALRGALLPVLARAARCTRDGDWIDLRAVLTPDSMAIVIEDEGAGLGAEDLGAAAGVTEAERTRGLGFGLATARALLEAHGGALRLEAVRGVGARAWLTLPRNCVVAA